MDYKTKIKNITAAHEELMKKASTDRERIAILQKQNESILAVVKEENNKINGGNKNGN